MFNRPQRRASEEPLWASCAEITQVKSIGKAAFFPHNVDKAEA